MDQKKIGQFIAKLRKDKGLTQEELAAQLGITKNAVSKWERGLSMMDVSLLKPVCDILDISIVELLNGERMKQEEIKAKTDDTIKNTIEYSNNRIKNSKLKSIIYTTLIIIFTCVFIFFGYKLILLNKYTLKKPDNVDEILKGIKNQRAIKIHKRTISEDEYLDLRYYKIRNDFKDFNRTEYDSYSDIRYYIYEKEDNGNKVTINFGLEKGEKIDNLQYIDMFSDYEAEFYGADYSINSDQYNAADRKYFLLKNDINDDIDFYKYIANNYYKENNIFMDKRTMMENYSFNSFVSVAIPKFDEFILINGDYHGYILKMIKDGKQVTQVTILRDGESYGFLTNDQRFKDENYLIDIIGTIEIK